jgi:hypothetical protein
MSFSQYVKSVQFHLLQEAGIPVTPEQLGLKVRRNPNPAFAQTLASTVALQQPPVPPENLLDPAAMAQYQQQVVLYQQRLMERQVMLLEQMAASQQQAPGQNNLRQGFSPTFSSTLTDTL